MAAGAAAPVLRPYWHSMPRGAGVVRLGPTGYGRATTFGPLCLPPARIQCRLPRAL